MILSTDFSIRTAASEWVLSQADQNGVVPWAALKGGFDFQGERVYVLSQQGIFKPA